MCSWKGKNIEQVLCDALDHGLIIKIRILYKNKGGPWENVQ